MFTIIVAVLDIIVCIALVILVIFQEGNDKGLGVIGGGADTFFGKEKGRTMDNKLKLFTTVIAIAFTVLTVLLFRILAVGGL
ncbi:MAG TPA: preprotein translocase subunit SecG [Clostridiaceae bacterium]|jgi:preprotein translocase subunit SecG|nr:preprotein translocase subunit SecG [Clostridiaceae bacterium]